MAAGTLDETKRLTYWQDGLPEAYIQKDSDSLGSLTYWLDGVPYAVPYSSGVVTAKTDTFMPFFWGI